MHVKFCEPMNIHKYVMVLLLKFGQHVLCELLPFDNKLYINVCTAFLGGGGVDAAKLMSYCSLKNC